MMNYQDDKTKKKKEDNIDNKNNDILKYFNDSKFKPAKMPELPKELQRKEKPAKMPEVPSYLKFKNGNYKTV